MTSKTTAKGAASSAANGAQVFSFGDPEPILDTRDFWSYFEVWHNGKWYEPPMPMANLARTFNMSPHHRSAIGLKVNLLVRHMIPTRWLSSDAFERMAIDFLQMGNLYAEAVASLSGSVSQVKYTPAIWTRVGREPGQYFFIKRDIGMETEHEFRRGSIVHIMQPDAEQEVYGVPEWFPALQSGLLSGDATIFRRKFYKNGAHAGFILYVNEPLADKKTEEAIVDQLSSAKGKGNFKTMFINVPGGKKDGVQVIPLSEMGAKDEFVNIKNMSRDDLLAAHRTPPQLIAIIPQNNGGFGDFARTHDVFFETEIEPLKTRMLRMNDVLGFEALKFRDYVPMGAAAPGAGAGGGLPSR